MLTSDAIKFFGSKSKLARAAGVELQSIYKWKKLVPEGRAHRLEEASSGSLHYDKDVYDQYRNAKRCGKQDKPTTHNGTD